MLRSLKIIALVDRARLAAEERYLAQSLSESCRPLHDLCPSPVERIRKAAIDVTSLKSVADSLNIKLLTEVTADQILQRQEILELEVVFNHLVTAALKVMNERAPTLHVVLADAPGQEVRTVLGGPERALE